MNTLELVEIFSEIDADAILEGLGDRTKLNKAAEIILLAQEGLICEFSDHEARDASLAHKGEPVLAFHFVTEEMRLNRLKNAIKVFPMMDEQMMFEVIWDENFCPIENARACHADILETHAHG